MELQGIILIHRCVLRSPNCPRKKRLSLRKNATRTTTTAHYDWYLHNNRHISDKYALTLRNEFDAQQEKTETYTPNMRYSSMPT